MDTQFISSRAPSSSFSVLLVCVVPGAWPSHTSSPRFTFCGKGLFGGEEDGDLTPYKVVGFVADVGDSDHLS